MTNSNISIIIPIHELTDDVKTLFPNAMASVIQQTVRPSEVIIVTPKDSDVYQYLKSYDFGEITNIVKVCENQGEIDFSSQFNFGVTLATSDWVSLLEFDDELSKIWVKNVVEHRTAYPEVGIFLPIIVDVDKDNQFIGFTNEAVWAQSFSDTLGVLDHDALLAYQNFNVDGMVIKKSLITEHGGFKSNIKLTFIYEFLLRMTFKSVKTMVIPKFGYKHVNQRPTSLFDNYKKTMDPNEAKWWLAQAKKEYYFTKDRSITYAQPTP
jgi:GT2 family glycosyltransferase